MENFNEIFSPKYDISFSPNPADSGFEIITHIPTATPSLHIAPNTPSYSG